ncbi:O-antigen ligase family protein [Butyrivibrio sp.]|uniref:O-antigen ligase family protein n=1 Tax=Butyrivibrio sp. TaxID=28121 RepID=UPI0025C42D5A|nr:O-antigen ligase family protein [Butyrivibrio sp.]MBE5839555.1 hypothetical protein [Butyrivibrio sp.]
MNEIRTNEDRNLVKIVLGLFAAFYIILPSYFAFEISNSLPLLTGGRILILILFFTYYIAKKGKIYRKISYDKSLKKALLCFFSLIITCDLVGIYTAGSEAIKDLFVVLFEGVLLTWLIVHLIRSYSTLLRFIEIIIYSSLVVGIISIIGVFLGINPFLVLSTVNRSLVIMDFVRMGLLRPQAGFDHAVHYGLYNAVMCSIILSVIDEAHGKKRILLSFCFIVDFIALILCNSRGSMIAFLFVFFIWFFQKRHYTKSFQKKTLYYLVIMISALSFTIIIVPSVLDYILNIALSLHYAFFGTSDNVIAGYGMNVNGLRSRTDQLSGVYYVLKSNPIFGMGANAQSRGMIQYFNSQSKQWYVTDTYDVGYIEIFCNFGLMGLVAYGVLFGTILKKCVSKKNNSFNNTMYIFRNAYLVMFIGYLSVDISGTSRLFWILTALFISYINLYYRYYKYLERNR